MAAGKEIKAEKARRLYASRDWLAAESQAPAALE
jgi:hypothetical protein